MWCLPTHKRPEKLQRFIDSLRGSDLNEPILLVLWKDDPRLADYNKMTLPKQWTTFYGEQRLCRDKMNQAFAMWQHDSFYGLLTDDIELATPGMLKTLREAAESGKFVWPNDGYWFEKLATHPVAPGELIRALGFWAHPDFPHNGIDSVLYIVAQELGLAHYMPECQIKVTHPAFGTAPADETYAEARQLNEQFSFHYDLFLRTKLVPLLKQTAQRLEHPL